MCGIIAVVTRPPTRDVPALRDVLGLLDTAAEQISGGRPDPVMLDGVGATLAEANALLMGLPGLHALLSTGNFRFEVEARCDRIRGGIASIEAAIERDPDIDELEVVNEALVVVKDGVWSVARDRLRAAEQVRLLAGADPSPGQVAAMFALHQALSALDRLEVRGRDSAGIELVISGHGLDLDSPGVRSRLAERSQLLFGSGSVRVDGGAIVFVYKAAAEIGELGDNTAALRSAVQADPLLREALTADGVEVLVLGHTRWASIGIISEPNAHPQGSDEDHGEDHPFVTAVLNGDVDNFADLSTAAGLEIPLAITTDAKVIPALMSRHLRDGAPPDRAFRETVAALEGSVAIAASSARHHSKLHLALRGSGQALYVGVAEDAFIVASEPYGLVEETPLYIRMDGETPADPASPAASRGQIIELDASAAGSLDGIHRWSYDGTELPVLSSELQSAQITTRDIDRGESPHFLLKEISDAPESFRKTLRGKLTNDDGTYRVALGDSTLPRAIREDLRAGRFGRVLVIGQGTAAVAGQSLAHHLAGLVAESPLRVQALPATELSGFGLRPDMSDTLVVAISQSGTTTDTNRTVDIVRDRGGRVISIVNRRNSDLCDKSDGVLYTSDGRDVEMSVASTKAFYSQIAAGLLLAYAIAAEVPGATDPSSPAEQRLLAELAALPDHLAETFGRRESIGEIARRFCPSRRYWAIVGNGANQIAARELRIKLSELCYKSIACDSTEDKKHIDLSAEPLILVCAAGLVGSTGDDVAKEVAIYRAHKAAPIVIASDGNQTFGSALAVISVPRTDPRLSFVLSAMAGHLFGYEAALAIDGLAMSLREARAAVERVVSSMESDDGRDLLGMLAGALTPAMDAYTDTLRTGDYNGQLEASTAVRLATMFRYATGVSTLDGYQRELGKVGTPAAVVDDLTAALTSAIEELTRPIDAIKHQAKTVTVGISRSDESVLQIPLVSALIEAGSPRDGLSYATLRSVADIDPAVDEVLGYTRYRIDEAEDDDATAVVVDRGGIAAHLPSRTDRDPRLRGTKHLVARERELMVAIGRSDGRTVLLVPETKDGVTVGLTLLHLRFHERVSANTARGMLQGYRRRYQALRDAVTETEEHFRDDLLAEQPVVDLLCMPILDLADRWRD